MKTVMVRIRTQVASFWLQKKLFIVGVIVTIALVFLLDSIFVSDPIPSRISNSDNMGVLWNNAKLITLNDGTPTENDDNDNNNDYHVVEVPIHQLSREKEKDVQQSTTPIYFDEEQYKQLMQSSQAKIAWLLTYPNSGTSYTMMNTQLATRIMVATNYWIWGNPPQAWTPQGPYLSRKKPPPMNDDQFILTKTHCGGYCSMCRPQDYVLTITDFEEQCRRTTLPGYLPENPPLYYRYGLAQRAVHLIRHPLDNLVSRMHLDIRKDSFKQMTEEFTTERERLLAWCNITDAAFADTFANTTVIPKHIKALIQAQKPLCGVELFRYLQWHGLAMEMTSSTLLRSFNGAGGGLSMPTLTFFYEDYFLEHHNNHTNSSRYEATVQQLLQFLNQKQVAPGTRFTDHKTYLDLYTAQEQAQVRDYLKAMCIGLGRTGLWKLLEERYFSDVVDETVARD